MTQTNPSPSNLQAQKRFLITGAKGFIGAWTAKTLLEQVLPHADGLIKAHGKQLPIAADLDDSALKHDLGEDPRTPLEERIRETADIFERLNREGRLETKELES
jgi:nucleoside-diphosphate-sugar epimerase